MVIVSCSAIGLSAKKYLSSRKNTLKSFIVAFQTVRSEILYRNADIPTLTELVCTHCGGTAAQFFDMIMSEGYSVMSSFNKNILFLKNAGLTDEDLSRIKEALFVLGRYDGSLQAERLENSIKSMENALSGIADEEVNKGKIYTALGITVGIMLVILLI
ncbi:MAG: stage III sporulation protein AB [Clostridia bacterium]|nr:stage III sporulation protein AB [Clostridia bacterium]